MNIQTMKRLFWAVAVVATCGLMVAQAKAVTPIENEIQKLLASDGVVRDEFGFSVSVDGDTALISAYRDDDNGFDSGSVYIFRWDGSSWVQQAKLIASDGAVGDLFGSSVALDGNTALIGAHLEDDNGSNSGAAYVFRWNGINWVEEAKLIASDGSFNYAFGWSVSLDGDTALIGAYADGEKGFEAGAAYVFRWDGLNWLEEAKLTASDAAAVDRFGWSVALDENTALIGAPLNDDLGGESGSAYVFQRSGTSWTEHTKLNPSDGAASDFFGESVAIYSGSLLVGAPLDDDMAFNSGAAYVFRWDGVNWLEEAKLAASDGAVNEFFGSSVAIEGDTALVGAYLDDDNGLGSGSAYVFSYVGGLWSETLKLLASDGNAIDQLTFRTGLSFSGSRVILGSHFHDTSGTNDGAAYYFDLDADDQPPMVENVTVAPNPVALNNTFDITATVDDSTTGGSPIIGASYSINGSADVSMDASDGTFDEPTEEVTATVDAGLETGVYDVCVTGTDAASNISEPVCALLAVYDPDGGFVTGGGWINSPEGAYAPDQTLTGKANFGFVSKYKKGSNEPVGQTEFDFRTAGLNFHSDNCEWLVVSRARAQFKGTGTINGAGNYGFMITAIDEALSESTDADLFRIKIWNIASGNVVYDNQMGGDDSSDPSTAISGGSIVIHTPKG